MQRCTTLTPHTTTRLRRHSAAMATALTLGLGLLAAVPAQAQTATFAPVQGQVRAFPPQALRGTLVVSSTSEATVDGKQLLLAPAFKLYNPQNATIRPGTASMARSASRARSSRLRSLTCGTRRKIGAVTTPRPVFDRDATARPLLFSRPSATSRLGPLRR